MEGVNIKGRMPAYVSAERLTILKLEEALAVLK
jgi:hypothetical protein